MDNRQSAAESVLDMQLREQLGPICVLVHKYTGNDFSRYKEGTLLRRIRHRLQALHVQTAAEYLRILDINGREAESLVKYLLIGVTQFFRDPEAFELLATQVLFRISQDKETNAPVRIWVAGCASGEEAYSIAILVREHLERLGQQCFVQLFATDLDVDMLAYARHGRYPLSICENVSAERLARFFVREGEVYTVHKELREMCLFSQHNLIQDPPFSQLDLISCRNVLIYLGADLQRKIVPLFHCALRPGGFLVLGPSEVANQTPELFESLDKKMRIYRRKETVARPIVDFPLSVPSNLESSLAPLPNPPPVSTREQVAAASEKAIVQQYAPAAPLREPSVVQQLQAELRATKAELRAAVEELESANEELKSSNEELISTNEELQTANEELQTSQEELHSLNEELVKVNSELREKVDALAFANAEIRQAEELAKEQAQLVHLSHDAIIVRSFDGTIESWNNGAQELYGFGRQEAIGRNSHQLLETEFSEPLTDIEAQLRRSGRWNGELRQHAKDGRTVIVLSSKQYARGSDGVERILEANHDITERAQAERDLSESEQKFAAIFDHAPFAIALIKDTDGTLTAVNDAWERMFGYRRHEALGRISVELGLASDPEGRSRMYTEVRNSGRVHDWELEYSTKAGERRLAAFSFDQIELVGQKYRLGTAVDITERKRAEQALRLSEEKFSKAFLGNTSAMAITRLCDGVFVEVNERWQEVTGYPRAEAVGQPSSRVRIWKNAEERALFVRELHQLGMVKNAELRFVRRSGAEWTGLVSSQIGELQGELVAISSIIDITERKRAEDELRRYALVVQQSRDIILFMDRDDGRIIETNPAAVAAYGYSRDELLGLTIHDLRGPETQSILLQQMESADTKGVLFETLHRRKDGSVFPVEVSSRGTVADGSRTLVSVVRDITERRRAEVTEREQRQQAEQRAAELDTILDALTEPLMVSDAQGKLVRANPAFNRMFGNANDWRDSSASERIRQVQLQTADGQPLDCANSPGARALAGETVHNMLQRLPRSDGSVLHLATSSAPIRTVAGIVGAVVVFSDITERVRAEQELREADQRKNEFLAVLSHELRNPLTPVRNSLYVLKNATPGSEQAKRAQAVIDRQTGQLARLVDDLLDITRVSQNKIRLRLARLDLNDVAQRALDDHRLLFEERGIMVNQTLSTEPLLIDADDARLVQVIGNLLSNAAKFTPRDGTVTLRTLGHNERRRAQLWVSDTGAGLEPAVLRRLFQPFMQAEMTLDRSEGGLGLGLALVKTLVELHGGEVCANSNGVGTGTEMVVELPLAAVPRLEGVVDKISATPRRRRVLIIEDNVDAADSLREALEFSGHVVEISNTGPDGLNKAHAFGPEVALCDIGLPGMDGYELARAFQADESLVGVYLVALTGYALPDDLERAAAAGFKRHIAKPPSIEALEEVLAYAP